MTTLFELIDELKSIESSLVDSNEDEKGLFNTWLKTQGNIADKMSAIAYVYKEKQASINAIKELIQDYQSRIKSLENEMNSLKSLLEYGLTCLDSTKLKTRTSTIFLKRNKSIKYLGKPEDFPPEYRKIRTEVIIDKQKVKEELDCIPEQLIRMEESQSLIVRIK